MSALFFQKSAHHSKDFFKSAILKQHKIQRPSSSLFQIARGSGATLSECTFSLKKRTSPRRLLQDKTTSRNHDKKKPDRAISEFFLIKNPTGHMLGNISTKDLSDFKTRPSSSLFQIARGSGATTRWMYFFFKKHSPLEDPKKRYKVSLQKALG